MNKTTTAQLLDAPITPEHTFGPAVDEMLQHSHRAQESTKELVCLLPKRPPQVHKPAANWRPRPPQPQRLAQPEEVLITGLRQHTVAALTSSTVSRRNKDLRLSHKPRVPFQRTTWSIGISAPRTSGCFLLYRPAILSNSSTVPLPFGV
ncbi:UNVERIFIED_CONTAM: hypothetical protein FKN15_002098 [Acipenser sinensis]